MVKKSRWRKGPFGSQAIRKARKVAKASRRKSLFKML